MRGAPTNLLSVLLLAVCLAACGGDDSSGTAGSSEAGGTTPVGDCATPPADLCGEFACGEDGACAFPKNRQCLAATDCGVEGADCPPNGFCTYPPASCFDGGAIYIGGACSDPLSWFAMDKCGHQGFAPVESSATYSLQGPREKRRFVARGPGSSTWDKIVIETRADGVGGDFSGPGTFDLGATGNADCEVCVLAYKGCHDEGCARTFLANAGTAVIEEAGAGGEMFSGTLSNLLFREVYIQPDTGEGMPLPAGETWCVENLGFEAEMEDVSLDVDCIPEGTGNGLGDNVADFTLQRCDGTFVSLHEMCGAATAVWLVTSAFW